MQVQGLPLAGVRVCDLTQVVFGPAGTQVLGDFGADIVKIERPQVGDLSRTYDRFISDGEESAYYMALNRNKRSIAIDIAKPEGCAIVKRIALECDVFIENFRPGVAARLGLDYETLSAANPRLIYASGTGFGSSGPLAHKGGQDLLAQALSGIAFRNRDDSGRPQLYPTALGDFSAAMILAQGIILALYQRERTGVGQKVEVNLLDTLLMMQQQEITQHLLRGKETNWIKQSPMEVFNTKDGHIAFFGVFKPNPIALLCRALEIDDLTRKPEFSSLEAQLVNRVAMREALAPAFARFTTEDCLARLEGEDLLCAPVLAMEQTLAHPQVVHNQFIVEFDHPIHGRMRTTGSALKMSSAQETPLRPPPTLGQDTAEVLHEMGFDAAAIDQLKSKGVVA